MKLRISKEAYDQLSDEIKALYVADGDGYKLDLEDTIYTEDDVNQKISGLRDKNSEILNEKKRLEEEARKRKQAKEEEEGNYKALYESSQSKVKELETQLSNRDLKELKSQAHAKLKSALGSISEGKQLNQLFALNKHRVDVVNGEIRVIDEKGQPSIMSIAELVKKIEVDPEFDNLIKGSAASGSGENSNNNAGGTGSEKWADFKPAELSKIRQSDPERYERLKKTK